MLTLQLKINNKFFNIACDNGQEEKLLKAANALNENLKLTYTQAPNINADLALIITALTIQDKLSDLTNDQPPVNNLTEQFTQLIDQTYKHSIVNDLDAITKSIEKLAIGL